MQDVRHVIAIEMAEPSGTPVDTVQSAASTTRRAEQLQRLGIEQLLGQLDKNQVTDHKSAKYRIELPRHWGEAPVAEITGHTIELLGFTSDEPSSVIAIGDDGRHIILQVIPPDTGEQVARRALDEAKRRAEAGNVAGSSAVARSVADVADKLASHEGHHDEQRTRQIKQWCENAAEQFVDAPVQTFIPILVEHIVRNRMIETRTAPLLEHRPHQDPAGAA